MLLTDLLTGDLAIWPILAVLCLLIVAYTLYVAIYRLYLSPIAAFPGPRFAALTFWNEFYYDVVLGGKYTFKLAEYHDRYGPIIRINPYEIHINDPYFYDELYVRASKGKTDKWYWSMRMFTQHDVSVFDTLGHEKHRMRREPFNPYFSKQSVSRLQPLLIQRTVDKLCDRLTYFQGTRKPVVMTHAYAALTIDIISEYSFPEGYDLLDQPGDFSHDYYDAFMTVSKFCHIFKQFGWLYSVFEALPLWFTRLTSPEVYLIISVREALLEQVKAIIRNRHFLDVKHSTARPSLFHALLDSELPETDKEPKRLQAEGQTTIGAGTLTTSHALKHATYHILANPDILARLMNDLETAIPYPDQHLELRDLERIHYLVAIMWETFRIFYGVTHRLQRIFPDRPLRYEDWVIPPGTPMSMTSVLIHDNPDIFPEPYAFKPERFLPLETEGQRLQRYVVCFGGGSRVCVGMELAKAEFLTTVATVFRRFGHEMRLHETIRERDIDLAYDVFNPLSSEECNGLLVMFEKEGAKQ